MRAFVFAAVLTGCVFTPATTPAGPPCTVGTSQECRCGLARGSQACVAPEGVWSTCGCQTKEGADVAVPPGPPPPTSCGGLTCAPYAEEDSQVGAKGCCTSDARCGSSSSFLFGAQCVVRGGPAGRPSAQDECPSESINFVDVEGCCRPDGACGLSIDAVSNFDLGCLERTEMARLLNAGSQERDKLSSTFFLGVTPASFAAKACTF